MSQRPSVKGGSGTTYTQVKYPSMKKNHLVDLKPFLAIQRNPIFWYLWKDFAYEAKEQRLGNSDIERQILKNFTNALTLLYHDILEANMFFNLLRAMTQF